MKKRRFLTSESVSSGHPDKICDQISDAILDACLSQDPEARVACECLISGEHLVIAGEISTFAQVKYESIARRVICEIWYTGWETGFDGNKCKIINLIQTQSPDIAMGVDNWGAGDQGIMFGYASDESLSFMPLSIDLSHKLAFQLEKVRKTWLCPEFLPDAKTQVTLCYEDNIVKSIDTIVISTQHTKNISQEEIKKQIKSLVIEPICEDLLNNETKILINPTGNFHIWGPVGDTGLTGRKIIVDTYGGIGKHGGGAFSGKDPSKVDRSAAYMARYLAKNIVASGLCSKCEIQQSYAIGVAEPVSIFIEDFWTGKIDKNLISDFIFEQFDLSPNGIIRFLNLKQPIYQKTASYGHFGRDEFSREKLNDVENFKKLLQ